MQTMVKAQLLHAETTPNENHKRRHEQNEHISMMRYRSMRHDQSSAAF